ncbi:ABC transporter ATP-binding protein [Flavobacteriales bacterium]|nr:ABC transporter ATP-binding protein [Flavobacteriales bacterium]MDB4088340.1 ABC transporter ATP-binding protein [Flavobacteriales bacterium]
MKKDESIISFYNLEIGYPDNSLSLPINLSIPEGELIALMGLNGVGKTTLFKTILKEQTPIAGEIKFREKLLKLKDLQHSIGVVYTERTHIFGFSVRDMIAMGRMPHTNRFGKLTQEDNDIIDSYISHLELEKIENKQIDKLSDGQFQKVMIARALAQETPVILLDEPTAFLDVKNKLMIYNLLKKLTKDQNKTILVSTHHIEFCNDYCDKVLLLKNKEMTVRNADEISTKDFD